ncbi:CHAT domain-containing protein [Streptomyces sp. CA2R106]|uniref:CHAT domain-containing protein n=1 Tax=Streptomyces sp. CA2R106 TaxID=3120153 RepID=UPI00300BEC4B
MPPADRMRRATAWITGVRGAAGAGPRSPRPAPLPVPRPARAPDAAVPDTPPEALGTATTDPTGRLPGGLAQLRVQRARSAAGEPAYVLTGTCGGSEEERPYGPPEPQLPPTDINLARVHAAGAVPSQFYRAVRHWSQLQRPLVGWLNDQRARHGAALHVVVWDDTDYEIPWELLLLTTGDGGPDLPLGAAVPVARWTTIRELRRPLLDVPADCSGRVLGYFDGRMRQDIDVFAPFDHEPHTDVDRFLDRLDERRRDPDRPDHPDNPGRADRPDHPDRPGEPDRPGLGLVYMGCHGTHGKRIDDLTAGMLTWHEMDEPAMRALRGGTGSDGTLVCLNVCHSGRLVENKGGGEDALRGFSELFLRKGAKACIATRGEVGESEARALLRHLVKYARERPGVPLAHMLRDFRALAVGQLPRRLPRTREPGGGQDVEAQRRVLTLLYHFMYVYYGHPLTTLRLTSGRRGPEAR